ncbi:hypothetical protein GGX14DRAFT_417124 [Mycena pura]|uniref:Uncharacterized protein n=1 Tax=Mycena pura TaxID=153505 RepID=A0AAD6YQM7_9AGAR|nr:hypothetical protein GGX14DRAFT_417124 [Mycena pura]
MRTASPPPAPPPVPPAKPRAPSLVPVPIPPAPALNGVGHRKGKGKAPVREAGDGEEESDDAASISSYETGHETMDEDGEETDREDDAPPPPPPHESANGTIHDGAIEREKLEGVGSDVSASSASTLMRVPPQALSQAPQRRKSVRVSLQPTFSTTPPATPDDDDDDENTPWGRGRSADPSADMWEDSSEEDVEYQKAKKLLNRLARKEKKKR